MLRYRPGTRRKKQPPKDRKPGSFLVTISGRIGAERIQTVILAALAAIAFARLASVALANPAPVAMPGDILQMGGRPSWATSMAAVPAMELANPWAERGPSCTLDIAFMARKGGALTVLAVRRDGVMLSWAGGPTTQSGQSCHAGHGGLLIGTAAYQELLIRHAPRH